MMRQGRPQRAARVSVPNQERAVVSADGTNTVGILCKLSRTGGSIRLSKSFRRGSLAQIALTTATGRISAAIEFVGAAHDTAQAFRFIHIDPADRKHLETALQQMLEQGLGEERGRVLRPLAQLAQRALGAAKKAVG